MTREEQLRSLVADLSEMVSLLERDPSCTWTNEFAEDLTKANELIDSHFGKNDLAALSSSIRSAYNGMGSFNDYVPGIYNAATGRCISFPWAGQFDRLSTSVFDRALALIVVSK